MITTTLDKISKQNPSRSAWRQLCKNLGGIKKYGRHAPLKFSQILESNGTSIAIEYLESICPEHDKEVRLFAIECAESVLHIYEDNHHDNTARKAIKAARDYIDKTIGSEEMLVAGTAAENICKYLDWAASLAVSSAASAASVEEIERGYEDEEEENNLCAARAARCASWAAARSISWLALQTDGAVAGYRAFDAARATQSELLTKQFS